jgi:hypothetical protein
MRGDFVLYEKKPNDLADAVVSWGSGGGKFVHVEIDLGDGTFIGEHGKGLISHPRDAGRGAVFVSPKSNSATGIEKGLAWVQFVKAEQEKSHGEAHEYGWLDIAADAFKTLGVTVILRKEGEWDCSHFVALYLRVAGADAPLVALGLMKNPETISPNDLAKAFGVSV